MKHTIFITIIILFLLAGCSLIHGELVKEKQQTYAEGMEFKFSIEGTNPHRINAVFDYTRPKFAPSTHFHAIMDVTLTDPEGKVSQSTAKIEGNDKDKKRIYHGVHEKILFDITPIPGEYTMKISDRQETVDHNHVTLKIYSKDEDK
ncbi:hypothetical protein ACFL0V_00315 [Nanoarchaeota archaeon]